MLFIISEVYMGVHGPHFSLTDRGDKWMATLRNRRRHEGIWVGGPSGVGMKEWHTKARVLQLWRWKVSLRSLGLWTPTVYRGVGSSEDLLQGEKGSLIGGHWAPNTLQPGRAI